MKTAKATAPAASCGGSEAETQASPGLRSPDLEFRVARFHSGDRGVACLPMAPYSYNRMLFIASKCEDLVIHPCSDSGVIEQPVMALALVAPRVTPPPSLKRTKIRLVAESKGIGPVTKMLKVGVALAAIWVVTLGAGGAKQAAVSRSV